MGKQRLRMLLPTVVVMILLNVSFRLPYFCNLISINIASYMYFVTILAFRCLLRAHVFPSTSCSFRNDTLCTISIPKYSHRLVP